jgi:hypothetical protein
VSPSNRKVGLEFGYDLQDLIYHIYKHQGRSGKDMPAHQYNRYINRQVDCHNTKQEFKQQACFRLTVGMMCHAYHADQPRSKKKSKEIYNKVLLLFNKHAKQYGPLVGGNSLVVWTMFGLYPLWFQTYRASPAKMDNRNTKTIVGKYQLETKSVE